MKYRGCIPSASPARVRPHARAGVEIFIPPPQTVYQNMFALMRGRELKCSMRALMREFEVRPHARAGVEMIIRNKGAKFREFALMRGRELKLP